jgi:hypothetical protein
LADHALNWLKTPLVGMAIHFLFVFCVFYFILFLVIQKSKKKKKSPLETFTVLFSGTTIIGHFEPIILTQKLDYFGDNIVFFHTLDYSTYASLFSQLQTLEDLFKMI